MFVLTVRSGISIPDSLSQSTKFKSRHNLAKTRIVIGRVITGIWHGGRATAYQPACATGRCTRGFDGVLAVIPTGIQGQQTLSVTEDHAIFGVGEGAALPDQRVSGLGLDR